ncbi:MAG TPA: phytanoyl-CoA dioxygenase family protein [Tepidisphaeraceae bacterium]|jgi:ectoine hydroxylase-related dioxygenase (phytanoyl-CoA dioxygenase family)|nr:phytanoyl-CoA dioxygenase family protein [Tepidisphaeraceae bacterium]
MITTLTVELPDLSREYAITPTQIAQFRGDGFIILRGLFSGEEIDAFRPIIRQAAQTLNTEKRKLDERDTYGKAFLQTQNLRLHGEGVMKLVSSRRLCKVMADLLGVEGLRIFHEQSLFKEPGQGTNPTPWHQDQYFWPLSEQTTIGFWLPLVDIEPGMGGMRWAAGSHTLGFLGQHGISDDSQGHYDRLIAERGLGVVEGIPMRRGDVSFHYGWTLHSALANTSNKLREVMVGSYYADGMRIAQPTNPSQEHDRVKFLGGRAVGELADSELNRLVFVRKQGIGNEE